MKQINSILRTLCLTALLCMTSVNASAYEIFNEVILSKGIYVVQQDKTISDLNVYKEQVLIILPGVTITVNTNFTNSGTIYVFGTLNNNVTNINENMGTIYLVDKGKIKNDKSGNEWFYKPQSKTFSEIATKKKQEVQAPTTTADGVREYWMKGIAQGDDFYPMEYYSDEDCNQKIDNFEEWKKGEGKPDWPKIGDKEYMFDDNLIFPDKAAYQCEYDFTVTGNLEYNRTFKATGVWQAWFVPFNVTVGKMNQAGMEVAEIAGVLMDENKQPYITFAKMTNTDAIVKANTPYVVKAKESSVSMTLTDPDMCIRKSTNAELEAQRLTVQSSYETFTFGGNYQPTKGYANEWYALNTSGVFQKMGDGADLAPQRFWMKIDTRTDTPYYTGGGADAKEFINMTVFGDDDPTGITSYENESESKGVIYNIHGQKVTRIQSGQVYIMNGKKYLAR